MQKKPYQFEVKIQNSGEEDSRCLLTGTAEACHKFYLGYIEALSDFTSYQKVLQYNGVATYRSPLVSQDDFKLWISDEKVYAK